MRQLQNAILSGSLTNVQCIPYSTSDDFFALVIAPFAQAPDVEKFKFVWQLVERKKAEQGIIGAQKLRYEILTPLVAFDLLIQAKKIEPNGSPLAEIQEVLNKINLAQWSKKFKITAQTTTDELTAINKLVKDLLNNAIKGQDLDGYHSKLKALAKLLDNKINEMMEDSDKSAT